MSDVGEAATIPPVASIIRKSETMRLSDARETLRAALPIPCRSKNLPWTVSSLVKSAPTIAKMTMPTSNSISVNACPERSGRRATGALTRAPKVIQQHGLRTMAAGRHSGGANELHSADTSESIAHPIRTPEAHLAPVGNSGYMPH